MALCQPMQGRSPSTLPACRRLRARKRFLLPLTLLQQQRRQQKRSCQTRRQGTLAACTNAATPGAPPQLFTTFCPLLQVYQSCVELEAVQVSPDLSLLKVSLCRGAQRMLLPPLAPPAFKDRIKKTSSSSKAGHTAKQPWSCCGAPAGSA